jgi:hypothetical protein
MPKISQLPGVTGAETLGTDTFPIVSGGSTKKIARDELKASLDLDAEYDPIGSGAVALAAALAAQEAADGKIVSADTAAEFPVTGDPLSLYIALDTGVAYQWVTDAYVARTAVLQIDESGDSVIVGAAGVIYKPLLAGVIVVAQPTVTGAPYDDEAPAPQVVSSQVITGTMTGEKLLYATVVRDDFGGMAASILTNPGHIYVPAGVKYAEFFASVAFPAEVTATGIRWARMVSSINTHKGNFSRHPTGVAPDVCSVPSALVPVTPGDYYWVGAVQNSGGNLTLGVGSIANNYASNWFQAKFYR